MGGRGSTTDRASSKFGAGTATAKATGGGLTIEGYGKAEQALARKLFGKNMSGAEIAEISGATPFGGAIVTIQINSEGKLQVDIEHAHIDPSAGMTRIFSKDADGKLNIKNEGFFLNPASQGKGLGTKSFETQVKAAQKAKVAYIKTDAARDPKEGVIGWKVWADVGYNAKVPDNVVREWIKLNPFDNFQANTRNPIRTVHDLYDRKGGREIWHKFGGFELKIGNAGASRMVFDLGRGSQSVKRLNKYVKAKARGKK